MVFYTNLLIRQVVIIYLLILYSSGLAQEGFLYDTVLVKTLKKGNYYTYKTANNEHKDSVFSFIVLSQNDLDSLSLYKNIESLWITNCDVKDIDLKFLLKLRFLTLENVKSIDYDFLSRTQYENLLALEFFDSHIDNIEDLFPKLIKLERLLFDNCEFKDTLNNFIGKLNNLKILYLNKINIGVFPKNVELLEKLRDISINSCNVQGLPDIFYNMTSLKCVHFSDIQIGFDDLKLISKGNNIEKLSFYSCGLFTFPYILGEMKHLKDIHLTSNLIKEIIECPEGFPELNSLIIEENYKIPISSCFKDFFDNKNVFLFCN